MTKVIKCLTVLQPYASAFFDAPTPKLTENRTYDTRVRGPVLIHAGKGLYGYIGDAVEHCQRMGWDVDVASLPRGAFVGIGVLYASEPIGSECKDPWEAGPWSWRFRSVCRFEYPVPWRGAQGFWGLDQGQLTALIKQAGRWFVVGESDGTQLRLHARVLEQAGLGGLDAEAWAQEVKVVST